MQVVITADAPGTVVTAVVPARNDSLPGYGRLERGPVPFPQTHSLPLGYPAGAPRDYPGSVYTECSFRKALLISGLLSLAVTAALTYTLQIDLRHINQTADSNFVELGIDLKEYYPSVEWDILRVPATRHEKFYPCCVEPYPGQCHGSRKCGR